MNNASRMHDLISLHHASAVTVALYPVAGPWGRALDWWRAAAELAPALPLGLGMLLLGDGAPATGDVPAEPAAAAVEYAHFLHAAAATPAVRTARHLTLSDVALAALLAHLAQGAPIPPAYRLPPGVRPDKAAAALPPPPTAPAGPADPSPAELLAHLRARLQALTPAELRFVAALGQGALGVTAPADLRALVDLLGLPDLTPPLAAELLAFLPALAEAAPGPTLQTYAVDGYGGLARARALAAVLPSEWALPPDLLHYRALNGELLGYGRERPPERRPTLLLLLVQLSDAMAGDLELLVKASALALAQAGQARGATVRAAPFARRLHPAQGLARPTEVAGLVRQASRGRLDLARVLGQVRAQVQAQAQAYAQIELVWLLHAQAGADQQGAVGALAQRLRQ
ncbi:MAG: hypothetical protein MI924_04630, partial [Chloroflexales bacterium]|nr:hypothetical protein [Chloroflexales bacterium]